jgi:hypothetical protein
VNVSLLAFAGFAFLFEIILGIGRHGGLNALVLIGLGLFLLMRTTGLCPLNALLSGAGDGKPKRKVKSKRDEDQLFTGPIVYGTRVSSRSASRLSLPESDDVPGQERATR